MAKHRVVATDADIHRALERAQKLQDIRVLEAYYAGALDIFVLALSNGRRQIIPREDLEGFQAASGKALSKIEILGNGTGLRWPVLDVDMYVPQLLRGIYGSKRWMAEMGRRGGRAKTAAKRKASQMNGAKGGRPRKSGGGRLAIGA